jgi:hypothetical protein
LQGTEPSLMQVLGELIHRMCHVRDFPSRLVTSENARLPPALQPGLVVKTEPESPFPRAGFYKDGSYYAVNRCVGNLVNVRHLPLSLLLWKLTKKV